MTTNTIAEPLLTRSMLDALLERWRSQPSDAARTGTSTDRAACARALIAKTIGAYLAFLPPSDLRTYESLIASTSCEELRDQFYVCFDLIVRTRGAATAVLRLQELHRLLS
ncbi:MAG: hypothetical protein KF871_16495 [Hydrogenophaga sp.]|uniref:hypothetical protein n=1 Tax=Hydrogenophaga sp. TaxID=1904254 RepID=UPI001D3B1853|nr:hypothetical protein [Hydrogenophaga sp.]MBX3611494.1 hypothetical protein [Hydrogenophaga sp.]